jgi:hypothetical protein
VNLQVALGEMGAGRVQDGWSSCPGRVVAKGKVSCGGLGRHLVQGSRQRGRRRGGGFDPKIHGAVKTATGRQFAEDGVRPVEEVLVDGHLPAWEVDRAGPLPGDGVLGALWFASTQNEQVGHGLGSSGLSMRAGG